MLAGLCSLQEALEKDFLLSSFRLLPESCSLQLQDEIPADLLTVSQVLVIVHTGFQSFKSLSLARTLSLLWVCLIRSSLLRIISIYI